MPKTLSPNPLISIIMPAYNTGGFIGRSIESIQAQSYPHWELLVVNDGSTDETGAVIQGYAQADARVRYIPIANLGRAGKVRNVGLKLAEGELIAFLDSDDEYLPEALGNLLGVFRTEPKTACVYAHQIDMDEAGQPILNHAEKETLPQLYNPNWEQIIMGRTPCNFGTLMMTRAMFEQVGFIDETLKFAEDRQYQTRLYVLNPEGLQIYPHATFRYRIRSTSVTKSNNTLTDQIADEKRVMNWLFDLPQVPSELHAYRSKKFISTYRSMAGIRFGVNQRATARKVLNAAWQDENIAKKDWLRHCGILYARTFLPASLDASLKSCLGS